MNSNKPADSKRRHERKNRRRPQRDAPHAKRRTEPLNPRGHSGRGMHQRGRAPERAGDDERAQRVFTIERAERREQQQRPRDQRERAEHAGGGVAHHLQAAHPRAAARPDAVGGVGEPVLVKRAGDDDEHDHGEHLKNHILNNLLSVQSSPGASAPFALIVQRGVNRQEVHNRNKD